MTRRVSWWGLFIITVLALASAPIGFLSWWHSPPLALAQSALGIALALGLFGAVYLFSQGGVGGGDLKYGVALGAILGPSWLLIALLIGFLSAAGAIFMLLSLRRRTLSIALTPFLLAGGVGATLLAWYSGLSNGIDVFWHLS